MDRTAFRAAIETGITALFDVVFQGAPDTYKVNGVNVEAIAVIKSAGTTPNAIARDLDENVHLVVIELYAKRAANGGEAAEDAIDELTSGTIAAVRTIHPSVTFQASDADARGVPNRRLDGVIYRHERVICSVEDEL